MRDQSGGRSQGTSQPLNSRLASGVCSLNVRCSTEAASYGAVPFMLVGIRREVAMAHFRKIGTYDQAGYDAESSRQILPRAQATTFYLIAGSHLTVEVDDPSVASVSSGSGDDKGAHRSGSLT